MKLSILLVLMALCLACLHGAVDDSSVAATNPATATATATGQATTLAASTTKTAARKTTLKTVTAHYISNLQGSTRPKRLGFDVFDTGPFPRQVSALPRGVKALVWIGQKCPKRATPAFRKKVRRLANNPRVFGYFLSDEPHIRACPKGPAGLASRADYIRRVSHGTQLTFIVLYRQEDYHAFRPAKSKVSLVGIDPYPCSVSHPRCDLSMINEDVRVARRAGIPVRKMAPVYQAFGQAHTPKGYYSIPSPAKLKAILHRWQALLPHPRMDFAYSWGNQSSASPTLINAPGLQQVFKHHFTR